jgi:mRNA interferase MazF
VVLAPFPFTDQSGTKKRPVVVVSSHGYTASRRDIVIRAIPSQARTPLGLGEAMVGVAAELNLPSSRRSEHACSS